VQASVGLDQLERLDDLNRARRDNALRLHERLAHVPELSLPRWPIRSEPVFLSYAVRHPRREALARALRHRGIDTTAGFLSDTSTEPAFAPWARPCPGSGEAHRTLLHLPVHPTLSRREQRKVAEEVRLAAHAIDGATG